MDMAHSQWMVSQYKTIWAIYIFFLTNHLEYYSISLYTFDPCPLSNQATGQMVPMPGLALAWVVASRLDTLMEEAKKDPRRVSLELCLNKSSSAVDMKSVFCLFTPFVILSVGYGGPNGQGVKPNGKSPFFFICTFCVLQVSMF